MTQCSKYLKSRRNSARWQGTRKYEQHVEYSESLDLRSSLVSVAPPTDLSICWFSSAKVSSVLYTKYVRIYIKYIQSIRSIVLKTYLLQNELIRQRKQEGRGGKLGILAANPIIKLSFY